jgi:hypothetical protein
LSFGERFSPDHILLAGGRPFHDPSRHPQLRAPDRHAERSASVVVGFVTPVVTVSVTRVVIPRHSGVAIL